MKKLIMSFLVASLLVTTALSLSSCKKTDTNENANTEEFIPTVYDVITVEDAQNLSNGRDGDGEYIDCYYCPNFIHPDSTAYPLNRLYRCDDNPPFVNEAFYCSTHSHVHYFDVTDDCTPPGQTEPYFCVYNGLRKHYHILTYTHRYFFNGWHVGGGAGSE